MGSVCCFGNMFIMTIYPVSFVCFAPTFLLFNYVQYRGGLYNKITLYGLYTLVGINMGKRQLEIPPNQVIIYNSTGKFSGNFEHIFT
jgi:hypothetical protein